MQWIEVYMYVFSIPLLSPHRRAKTDESLVSLRFRRNQPEVRKALGVSSERTFESCNMQVNQAFQFQGDVSHNTAALIPPLLEDGIRVLIYAGDADFMVRPSGYYSLLR